MNLGLNDATKKVRMMHATELSRNYTTRYCVFAVDGEEHLVMLPTSTKVGTDDMIMSTTCCAGSIARCQNGTTYVLNGSDEWVKYSGHSGGGGGGDDPEDAEPISDDDIEHLFE